MDTAALAARRRTGTAAVLAGVLLFVSVAAELVHPVQQRDGDVTEPALFGVFVTGWVLGCVALLVAISGLRLERAGPQARRPRGYLVGRRISLVAAGLLLAWGVVAGVTGLVSGRPLEASFVFFGLGLLLTVIGNVTLGLSMRRSDLLGSWWPLLVIAGAGALLAVTVFADPWHDLGMFTFDAAWVLVGVRLLGEQRL